MANNTKEKAKKVDTEVDIEPVTNSASEDIEDKKPVTVKDIDPTQYVVVRNGFHGKLVYKSQRTGEVFVWDGFGSEQEMELRELRNVKNSHKKFFINNWFMFDESWIPDYLGVKQFYKNALDIDHFDDIFSLSVNKLKEKISVLSDGQKKTVAYRAKELIADGVIDSRKAIAALEETLDVDLIEK